MRTAKSIVRFEGTVQAAVERAAPDSGRVVVAVSGGTDSLALLYALSRLKDRLRLQLLGAHLDHGLRGEESAKDARFVEKAFRTLEMGFTSEHADLAAFRRRHKLSTEQAAREVRYSFLARVASEHGADAVALGHTADDQAETVMMNIIRGTGIQGLKGMLPVSRRKVNDRSLQLLRPLLGATRAETSEYCRALGLDPRTDESNKSTEPTRNWIRIDVLPRLRERNPGIREALVRLADVAGKDLAHLDNELDEVWDSVVQEGNDLATIDHDAFGRLSPALKAQLLRRVFVRIAGEDAQLEQAHVDDMRRLIGGQAGRNLGLPGGIHITTGYSESTLAHGGEPLVPLPPLAGEQQLNTSGGTKVGGWRVTTRVIRRDHDDPRNGTDSQTGLSFDGGTATFDFGAVGDDLSIRSRRPGDRFQPLGMSQSKKLQDFMVDAKIPRRWRERVPLIASPRGILWVAGWRIAHWARVQATTTKVLEIELQPSA